MFQRRIAFVVGRYQNVELHQGYLHLFRQALLLNGVTDFVPVMGTSPIPSSRRNPFTFEERKQLFVDSLSSRDPDMLIVLAGFLEQHDQNEDPVWSKNLDNLIDKFLAQPKYMDCEPVLVCSRDSFKSHYSGYIEVVEIEPDTDSITSTEARAKLLQEKTYVNRSYAIGKLKAINSKYPTVYPTVDIAIINVEKNEILLGRKPRESKFRFPGGFSDPTDASFLAAAKREAREEVGQIELSDWQHVTSMRVDDWRYRSDVDKIITNFYRCSYIFGRPIASDDLAEVKWFNLDEIKPEDVFPGHVQLLETLKVFEKGRKEIEEALDLLASQRALKAGNWL